MAFTVTRAGATDVEDVRVLHRHGKPQAIQPRVPDPEAPTRRGVPIWDTEEEAQTFVSASDTESSITSTALRVVRVDEKPLPVQISQRADEWLVRIRPLTLSVLQQAFPSCLPCTSLASLTLKTWNDFPPRPGESD